jgi:hypothetical protein
MTRRCFFATAGLAVAAPAAAGAGQPAAPDNLPKAALLSDGDARISGRTKFCGNTALLRIERRIPAFPLKKWPDDVQWTGVGHKHLSC